MDSKVALIAFTDRQRALLQAVADERGISFEEAVAELFSEGFEQRFRRHTGRAPARVYSIKGRH